MRISTVRLLQESKRIAQEDNMKNFKAYPSWMFRFMKRNNLSVRLSTSVVQKLVSLKHTEMERSPVTVIMYMTIHFQKWKKKEWKKYQKRS